MDTQTKIVNAIWDALRGADPVPAEPGMCLAYVRMILERALFEGRWALYDRYLVTRTSMRQGHPQGTSNVPWAADLEASAKQLELSVPLKDRQAGDLVFNHTLARPYGHVGILLASDVVAENIRAAARPTSIILGRHQAITKLEDFQPTLVARIPKEES